MCLWLVQWLVGMWIAFVAAALLVTVFIGKVSEALREREHEVLLLQSQLASQERLTSVATLAAGAWTAPYVYGELAARGHEAPSRFRRREKPRYSTASPMRSNRGVAAPTGQSLSIE